MMETNYCIQDIIVFVFVGLTVNREFRENYQFPVKLYVFANIEKLHKIFVNSTISNGRIPLYPLVLVLWLKSVTGLSFFFFLI